ncbi:MAG: hypothetical protein QOE11_2494 [Solirubrobacteraceae bacterium]|jgi:hypothetical protein|nr:hypothetical protein [Solirubrobacteraceae bacterium]
MSSSGKKKTTMAKLNRESRMRERRLDKQARKDARKREAARPAGEIDETVAAEQLDESGADALRADEAGVPVLTDA